MAVFIDAKLCYAAPTLVTQYTRYLIGCSDLFVCQAQAKKLVCAEVLYEAATFS